MSKEYMRIAVIVGGIVGGVFWTLVFILLGTRFQQPGILIFVACLFTTFFYWLSTTLWLLSISTYQVFELNYFDRHYGRRLPWEMGFLGIGMILYEAFDLEAFDLTVP